MASFKRVLDFIQQSGLDELRLLGGEPTLHPEFINFLKIGLKKGLNIRVFSNGMMTADLVSDILLLNDPKLSFVINSVDPDTYPDEYKNQSPVLTKLGSRASIGINIYQPGQNLDYLIPMIKRHHLAEEIRIGLAHPTVPPGNQSLHPKFYPIVGDRLWDFYQELSEHHIRLTLDCGFVPCMFPDELKSLLMKQNPDLGLRCNPVLDVLPDEKVISCFPLHSLGTKTLNEFQGTEDIRKEFLRDLAPYESTGIYPHCIKCEYFISKVCHGGCRAQVINRFLGPNRKQGIKESDSSISGPSLIPTQKPKNTSGERKKSMDKKWTIPYIDQAPGFWQRIHDQYGDQIEGVYFPLPGSLAGSGRPQQSQKHLEAFLQDSPIKKTLTINPIVLPDTIENIGGQLVKEIEILHRQTPLHEITLANASLAQLLKKELPEILLTASTLMDIHAPNQIQMLGGVFDRIVPSGKILRHRAALLNLKKGFSGKIRLLVNEACIPGCIFRVQHFFEMSSSAIGHPDSLCQDMLSKDPWLRLTGVWVLPQFLDLYDELCDEYKLAGRVTLKDPENYMQVLGSYINRDVLNPFEIGGGPASPPEWMHISREFFEFTLTCDQQCTSCSYCRDYWNTMRSKLNSKKTLSAPGKTRTKQSTALDQYLLENRELFPAEIKLEKIREDWRRIPQAYNYKSKSMPSPEWREYGLSDSPAESWEILKGKIAQPTKNPLSVYIHVPFCDRRCNFCDCHSLRVSKGNNRYINLFTSLLLSEIELWTDKTRLSGRDVSTVHFGGGTPNFLPMENLLNITGKLRENLAIHEETEFALESTGSMLTDAHLSELLDSGITRLHVGIQTLNDSIRKKLGRKETAREILKRLVSALNKGFTVSIDLIFGLPGQRIDSVMETLSLLTSTGIHGVSLYHLNISDRNRKFFENLEGFRRDLLHDYILFQTADQYLIHKGYRKNHFVHYALEQDKNLYYNHVRRGEDLLALGPTADGFFDDYFYIHKWTDEYLAHDDSLNPPIGGGGYISDAERSLRSLKSQLLCSAVSQASIPSEHMHTLFKQWVSAGLLQNENGTYHLTGTGSWFIDRMASDLIKHGI